MSGTVKARLTRRSFLRSGGGLGFFAGVFAPIPSAPPPKRWLRVLRTRLAGCRHYVTDDQIAALHEAQPLVLRREPTNPHDYKAIEVYTLSGTKLGYLPRADNKTLFRLMDAKIPVRCRVRELFPEDFNSVQVVVEAELERIGK